MLQGRRRRRRPSTRRSSPRTTRRATSSSASTTPCSPARSTTGCSRRTRPRAWTRCPPTCSSTRTSTASPRRLPATSASTTTRRTSPSKKLAPPQTFDDLIKPAYKNLLVTENAATSSPGPRLPARHRRRVRRRRLAGLLEEAEGQRRRGRRRLGAGVQRASSPAPRRQEAKGDRPLVVSYASSPPAEVLYAKPQPDEAPTGVATGTCFRQIEFAGLLKGAKNDEGGKALLDFLLSKTFQEDMPLQHVRQPGARGRQAAGGVHQVRRDGRRARRPWPRRRSPRTVSSGSSRGPRSS